MMVMPERSLPERETGWSESSAIQMWSVQERDGTQIRLILWKKMESFMEEELQMIKALWCLHFLLWNILQIISWFQKIPVFAWLWEPMRKRAGNVFVIIWIMQKYFHRYLSYQMLIFHFYTAKKDFLTLIFLLWNLWMKEQRYKLWN